MIITTQQQEKNDDGDDDDNKRLANEIQIMTKKKRDNKVHIPRFMNLFRYLDL